MKKIMEGWNWMRILRLLMGIFILFEGIQSQQTLFIVLGICFSILPLFNLGCCTTSAYITHKTSDSKEEVTTFTEIK